MGLPSVLAQHVHDVVGGLGNDDGTLSDALAALVRHLDAAVSSYLGLRLSLVLDGWPVTLTAFVPLDGLRPVTSLRLALSSLGGGFDPASQIVFYAGTPGTFVDLAADFAHLHGPVRERRADDIPVGGHDRAAGDGHRPSIALDVELPPPTVAPGITGLTEYARINRALGMLLEHGQDPDEARASLRRGASAAGLDLPGYATRLLQE